MVTPNKPTEAPAALILSRDFPNMALVHGSLASVQPKQWFLLLLLAARPFQLLKYKELRHQLWPHIIVEDQQLYFQVRKLRAALELADSHASSWIHTFTKKGYSLWLEQSSIRYAAQPFHDFCTGK